MQVLQARKNLRLVIPQRAEEILIGCILGDAYITKLGKIRIEHSLKQKDYLLWKYNELKSLAYSRIYEAKRRDKRNGNVYRSLYITLRQYFRPWRNIWYRDNRKIFPEEISITNLSLAVWYMDDGYLDEGRRFMISIDGFSEEDKKRIKKFFQEKLHLETVIHSHKKLLIRKCSAGDFLEKIKPFILPCMKYKILNPVTTDSDKDEIVAF